MARKSASEATRRTKLIALVHAGAKKIGMDDDIRRLVQERITGKASAAEMSEAELVAVCYELARLGADIHVPAPQGGGPGMATDWQLLTIERLALKMGWREGLQDKRLLDFIKRTVKVDRPQWLEKEAASHVISGLLRWQRQRERRSSSP
jgi:hypothetical protein